jgi:hypothetical protein
MIFPVKKFVLSTKKLAVTKHGKMWGCTLPPVKKWHECHFFTANDSGACHQ